MLFVPWESTQSLHIVQAIREFQQNDADVLDHCQHHLTEAFDLNFGTAIETESIEFADAIDDSRNLRTETIFDLILVHRRVFEDIVHYGGSDTLIIEMQIGEDAGDCDWVSNVRFSGITPLTFVCLGAELIRIGNDVQLIRRQVAELG